MKRKGDDKIQYFYFLSAQNNFEKSERQGGQQNYCKDQSGMKL